MDFKYTIESETTQYKAGIKSTEMTRVLTMTGRQNKSKNKMYC